MVAKSQRIFFQENHERKLPKSREKDAHLDMSPTEHQIDKTRRKPLHDIL